MTEHESRPTLVLGGTGKTGRRVADRLTARGVPIRLGSRSARLPFDWEDRARFSQNFSADYIGEHVQAGEVALGRNAHLADGVQRARGRAPRDFADFAREAATTGVWNPAVSAA